MSDVNPNAEVGAEENMDAGFGEGLSFDEVESLDVSASQQNPQEVEQKEQQEAAPAKEEKVEEEQSAAEVEAEVRKLKAMLGESEFELPEDALFTQKVNGEDVEVSIKDLLTDYSGKTDWTRKYNELGKDKESFKKAQAQFDDRVNTFVEKAKESKLDALAYLAETAGADPVAFIKEFRQDFMPNLEEYMNMSEAEKAAFDYKQELDILKKSNETRTNMEQMAAQREELEQTVNQEIESLGIEKEEYAAAFDRLVQQDIMDRNSITPDAVSQWIRLEQRVALVDSAIQEISPDLAEDTAFLEDLVRTSHEAGLDDAATLDVIKELCGQPSTEAKSVSKKVRQSGTNLKTVTKKITESDSDDVGPISFDDL